MNKLLLVLLFIIMALILKNIFVPTMAQTDEEEDIARLTIFSYDGKSETKNLISAYGHTFLAITNLKEEDINLHGYLIKMGDSVFFSWWAIDCHMGIWFNIESNYINIYNRYDTRYSISTFINHLDIEKINDYMNKNDCYTPFKNCSRMSLGCWNLAADESEKIKIPFITTPKYVVSQIQKSNKAIYQENIETDGPIGYFRDGKFVEFEMENRYA